MKPNSSVPEGGAPGIKPGLEEADPVPRQMPGHPNRQAPLPRLSAPQRSTALELEPPRYDWFHGSEPDQTKPPAS